MGEQMKKTIYLIITIFGLLFLSINVQAEETNIVCTNSVLADYTSNLITENVTITHIMPGGACPSHFDLTPSQASQIIEADIVISLGWEPWLTNISDKLIDVDQQQIKCPGLGEWSLPSNTIKFVEKIRDRLGEILSEKNTSIQTNAEEYIDEINKKSEYLQNMITTMNYENRKVIVMNWQKEFIEWLGLTVAASYGPPERLSTQDKLNITTTADDGEITVIIDNLQSGIEFGEQTAKETGKIHVVFTNFPGAIENVDTYLEMLEYNTAELIKGITNYDYLQGNINLVDSSDFELQRNTAVLFALISIILALIFYMMYRRK
jgi:ABC-type Zn uptake system ZnuABC Zn-binding protein ZnuA